MPTAAQSSHKEMLEFPIDTLEARWVEFIAVDASGDVLGYVAYALMVGGAVTARVGSSVETAKGTINVFQDVTEYWFTPTADAITLTEEHTLKVVTTPTKKEVIESWDKVIDAVEGSSGLASSSGTLSPTLIAPVGPVPWSNADEHLSLVSELPTFVAEIDEQEWGLTFKQAPSSSALQMVYTTTPQSSFAYGKIPKFPASMSYSASHEPARIFIGCHAPPS